MKKIAFITSAWFYEVVGEFYKGIQHFYDDYDDVSVYIFQNLTNYSMKQDNQFNILQLLHVQDFDGIIMQGDSHFPEHLRQQITDVANKENIPVISMNYPLPGSIYIGTDNQSAMYELVDHILTDYPIKDIAFVKGRKDSQEAKDRLEGFINACHKHNIHTYHIYEGDWNKEAGVKAGLEIISTHIPELIVCANDDLAIGILSVLKDHHLNIKVTGFDNQILAQVSTPRLTTVDRDYPNIIYTALKLLVEDIPLHHPVYTKSIIQLRESCGYTSDMDISLQTSYYESHYYTRLFFERKQLIQSELLSADTYEEIAQLFTKHFSYFGYKNSYLIINDDYIDHDISINQYSGYSEYVHLKAISNQEVEKEIFQSSSYIPKQYKNNHQILTFIPLEYHSISVGYLALEGIPPTVAFHYVETMVMLLCIAIDNVRQKNILTTLNHRLEDLSTKDSLSDCYNRFGLDKYAHTLYDPLLDKEPIQFYFIDMDGMKKINDIYGHDYGDLAVQDLAHILKHMTRHTNDFVMRYGGDEFVIISLNIQNDYTKMIQHDIDIFNENSDRPYQLSVSIGLYYRDIHSHKTLEECIKEADNKMYIVKKEKYK